MPKLPEGGCAGRSAAGPGCSQDPGLDEMVLYAVRHRSSAGMNSQLVGVAHVAVRCAFAQESSVAIAWLVLPAAMSLSTSISRAHRTWRPIGQGCISLTTWWRSGAAPRRANVARADSSSSWAASSSPKDRPASAMRTEIRRHFMRRLGLALPLGPRTSVPAGRASGGSSGPMPLVTAIRPRPGLAAAARCPAWRGT